MGHAVARGEDRIDIGAAGEKSPLCQAHLAGKAEQQVEAQDGDGVGQHDADLKKQEAGHEQRCGHGDDAGECGK